MWSIQRTGPCDLAVTMEMIMRLNEGSNIALWFEAAILSEQTPSDQSNFNSTDANYDMKPYGHYA